MKQKTGRKLLGFLLTLALVLGLMPGMGLTARAEEAENAPTLAAGSDSSGTGWNWTASTKTLTLSGVTWNSTLVIPSDSTIILTEGTTNTITGSGTETNGFLVGLYAEGNLTINGSGILNVYSNANLTEVVGSKTRGIYVAGKLTINGGTIQARSGNSSSNGAFHDETGSVGVYVKNSCEQSGGSLTAISGTCARMSVGFCLDSSGDTKTLKITGGTLIATAGDATNNSYGLMVDNSGVLEIMGGTVKATGGKATSYASEGIFVNGGSGTLNLSGGECWATSSQGDVSYAFRCQGNINISGGILHVSSGYTATASNSQGIRATDSEGKITITGGMIAASSCDGGDTIYSKGTITVSHELITENQDTGYDTTSNSTDFTSGTTQTLKQSDYSKPLKIGKVGHMVAYDENGVTGGAAPSDDTVYANNAQVTVAGNTLNMYKTGYKFDKWNTKADGTGADYVPGTTFNITDDTTLYAQWKELEQLEYTVTFKVVNGSWDDDTAGDKTVTLSGLEGDVLKLSAEQIPAVGSKPNDTYKAGSWDTTPSAETEITADTTYTYTYAQKDSISQTVTFKVVNGSWNDETTTDKTVTLTGYEGDTLKLVADQIPTVGTKPNDTYKAGSWDVTPSTETEITAATTYTYTYAQKDAISQTVTFKVVNGSWNDETTTDKTVTLTGYEGDTLKLAEDQIPTVGTKPNDTYKAGSWDVTPSTETEITAATTYTYTYAQKDAATVTKAPEAKTLTYTGSAQSLVTAGTAAGGEMRYALGNETRATQPYTTSIPTVTNAGTYYVWYKVVGDENHTDTEPVMLKVTIDVAKGETKIETEVQTDEKSPKLEASNLTKEVAESTLTDEEKAEIDEAINNGEDVDVDVYLEIKDISDTISASNQEKIKAVATDADKIEFFDISLFKEISISGQSQGATSIHDLATPLKLTIGVPSSFPAVADGYTRTYVVLRLHEGSVTVLPTTLNADGTLSFETDRFSTYALAYTDTKEAATTTEAATTAASTSDATTATATEAAKTSPKTGDSMPIAVMVVLMFAVAGALVFMDLKKKKN